MAFQSGPSRDRAGPAGVRVSSTTPDRRGRSRGVARARPCGWARHRGLVLL